MVTGSIEDAPVPNVLDQRAIKRLVRVVPRKLRIGGPLGDSERVCSSLAVDRAHADVGDLFDVGVGRGSMERIERHDCCASQAQHVGVARGLAGAGGGHRGQVLERALGREPEATVEAEAAVPA